MVQVEVAVLGNMHDMCDKWNLHKYSEVLYDFDWINRLIQNDDPFVICSLYPTALHKESTKDENYLYR